MTMSPQRLSKRLTLGVTLTALVAGLLAGCAAPAANQSPFVGTWGTPGAAGSPSLVISADGSITGTEAATGSRARGRTRTGC